ncbi:hypothetical protein GOBAR_AA03605 [Gossypium barbadense]|uniref:Uncharacterized protein n=1 Tax=Gossypium barbadense TaxID=3634 RepID=A0A2P5YN08_GOSBA|nr:hypothetical protein GOBAR_AA03605 [Gossypium barbadense]
MSCDEEYYLILHAEFNREDDVKWVKAAKKGDVEGVEAAREGDVEGVEAVRKGSTVGEDNDSGFGSSIGHENVIDFATSVGKDNDNAIANREKESKTMLDENEIEVWDPNEHESLVGSDEEEKCEDATIKDHPKMKLGGIQRICASNMHVNVSIDYFYKAKKIVKEKMVGNSKKEFGMLWDYAQELRSKMLGGTIKTDLEIVISYILLRVEHRNCARYISANWSRRKLEKSFEFNFWLIMKSTIEREYEELCVALEKKDKEANNNLMRKSQKMWTRDFFGTTCKSNLVGNNSCETFDSSIIETRFKSIIRMPEDIKTKMMTRIVQKRKLCNGWKQNYGLLVKVKIDSSKKDCVEWKLIWNGKNRCEMRKGSYQYIVDLSQRKCSCRS